MTIEILNSERKNLMSIYDYKFVIKHEENLLKVDGLPDFKFDYLSIEKDGNGYPYLQVIIKEGK